MYFVSKCHDIFKDLRLFMHSALEKYESITSPRNIFIFKSMNAFSRNE